jgi:hypothetical protein
VGLEIRNPKAEGRKKAKSEIRKNSNSIALVHHPTELMKKEDEEEEESRKDEG